MMVKSIKYFDLHYSHLSIWQVTIITCLSVANLQKFKNFNVTRICRTPDFCHRRTSCCHLSTVLVLSKLKKLKQPHRNRNSTFLSILQYSRMLHIVWSLVRRRVTWRLTRLQTMYNVLTYRKTWWNNDKNTIYRNRNATATKPNFFVNLIRTSTVPALNRQITAKFWPTSFDVTIETIVSIVTSNLIGQN